MTSPGLGEARGTPDQALALLGPICGGLMALEIQMGLFLVVQRATLARRPHSRWPEIVAFSLHYLNDIGLTLTCDALHRNFSAEMRMTVSPVNI
ncbi:hypothetical protein SFRURICE_016800 [Spodoptera frugiperda]|nr:hypothetical protein SFRURICE_016800 [Spodoptera frugiperda]